MSNICLQYQKPVGFVVRCTACSAPIKNEDYVRLYSSNSKKEDWNFHTECFNTFLVGVLKFYDVFISNPSPKPYLI